MKLAWMLFKELWRKPDNIVWGWPWQCFCFGWSIQSYSFDAICITICIGCLTLRWHRR